MIGLFQFDRASAAFMCKVAKSCDILTNILQFCYRSIMLLPVKEDAGIFVLDFDSNFFTAAHSF